MKSLPYAVYVAESDGIFELQIRELCIVARGPDLSETYDALRRRADQLVEWAISIGQIELPTPLHKVG